MAVCWSKLVPPEYSKICCHEVLHPNSSCSTHLLEFLRSTIVGTSIFYFLFYIFQHLTNLAKNQGESQSDWREVLKEFWKNYVRVVLLLAVSLGPGTVFYVCLLRNFIGRLNLFFPSFLGGLGIFFLEQKFKALVTFIFTNASLTVLTRKIELNSDLKQKIWPKTLIYMSLCSAISVTNLLCHNLGVKQPRFWFFNAKPPIQTPSNQCYHSDDCSKYIFSTFLKYFSRGFLLSLLRISFKLGMRTIKSPSLFVRRLLLKETYLLPAFLSSYPLIFQIVRCSLYKNYRGMDLLNSGIAGWIAGISYLITSSTTVFNTAVISLIQVLGDFLILKGYMPRLPYPELAFALSTAILFETTIFAPKLSPGIIRYIIATATNGRSTEIHRRFVERYNVLAKFAL